MAIDVRDLLSKPSEEYKRPPNLRDGHYFSEILGFEFTKARNEEKTDICRVGFKLEGPGEDVDPDDCEGIDFSTRRMSKDFWLTPDSVYRLREFVDAVLGPEPKRTLDERLPDIRGQRVLIKVTSRTDKTDSDIVYNDVGRVTRPE